jgi:hypothetical protein
VPGRGGTPDADQWVHVFLCSPGCSAYTWGDRARALAWSVFGNLIGGIALVTSIRLLQMPHRIAEERTQR